MDKYFKNNLPICKCNCCYNNLGHNRRIDEKLCGTKCVGLQNEGFRNKKIKIDGITYITVNPYIRYKNFKPNANLLMAIENRNFIKEDEFKI